ARRHPADPQPGLPAEDAGVVRQLLLTGRFVPRDRRFVPGSRELIPGPFSFGGLPATLYSGHRGPAGRWANLPPALHNRPGIFFAPYARDGPRAPDGGPRLYRPSVRR